MCEYCENGKPIIESNEKLPDRVEGIRLVVDDGKLKVATVIHTGFGIIPPAVAEVEIRFCPMCGRKLEVD